jgi:hypothetical protein
LSLSSLFVCQKIHKNYIYTLNVDVHSAFLFISFFYHLFFFNFLTLQFHIVDLHFPNFSFDFSKNKRKSIIKFFTRTNYELYWLLLRLINNNFFSLIWWKKQISHSHNPFRIRSACFTLSPWKFIFYIFSCEFFFLLFSCFSL